MKLEHLRFGKEQPIFLFNLQPITTQNWQAIEPHQCGADFYQASLHLSSSILTIRWQISGPNKDEKSIYCYR